MPLEINLNSPQNGAVSAVSGTWKVPTVTGSGTTYSSVWVGIDGYGSSTVEQLGTEQDVVNGKAEYSVWYEMYPAWSIDINSMSIAPGDAISASVTYFATGTHAGQFQLSITDTSQSSDSFTTYQTASQAQRSSAEWIVEAPSNGTSTLPLANFGSVTFSNATATINGVDRPHQRRRLAVDGDQYGRPVRGGSDDPWADRLGRNIQLYSQLWIVHGRPAQLLAAANLDATAFGPTDSQGTFELCGQLRAGQCSADGGCGGRRRGNVRIRFDDQRTCGWQPAGPAALDSELASVDQVFGGAGSV